MGLNDNPSSNQNLQDLPPDSVLFGNSKAMQELKSRVMCVCLTTVPVLLQGEVGVGKSVLSRFIHQHSPGAPGLYVSVNCAALGAPLAVEDPFLHWYNPRGVSHGSGDGTSPPLGIRTLFLEQVSELTPLRQRQLAHSLAEADEFARVHRQGNARVVCSSTRNLRREVKLGHFRRDLFDGLMVVVIDVPPLRTRLEDLPGIAEYLRLRHSAQLAVAGPPFPEQLFVRMRNYKWPGNIRELENFVWRYVVLGCEDVAAV